MLYVRAVSGSGRGVFADKSIRKGEVIEECPVVPITRKESDMCKETILDSYFFLWGDAYAAVLGYGMLYNHSHQPNAESTEDYDRNVVVFRALRDIPEGEEITHDYTGEGRPLIFREDEWLYADTMEPYEA